MKFNKIIKYNIIISLFGCLIGFLNGFFGGGGGMICVPFMEEYLKYDEKDSHATSLCVILPLCIFSSFVYIYNNNLNFDELLLITIGSTLGSVLGSIFFKKISGKTLKVIFAILMLCCGLKLVIF